MRMYVFFICCLKFICAEGTTPVFTNPNITVTTPSTTNSPQFCSATTSELAVNVTVTWLQTQSKSVSKPLCINEVKEPAFRECQDGNWGTEPLCYHIQPLKLPQCPDGFGENSTICYIFTIKTKFPPKCPLPNMLPFDSFIESIGEIHQPVWVPVRRNFTNGAGLFVWVEASDKYRQVFDKVTEFSDRDCVIYNNSYKVVSCDEEHLGVCAYTKLNKTDNAICNILGSNYDNSCRQSNYESRTKCMCMASSIDVNRMAEFSYSYQNWYRSLIKNDCNIGLEMNAAGRYIWTTSQKELSYTYWSITYVTQETSFDNTNKSYVLTADGWAPTELKKNCSIIEINTDLNPYLRLAHNLKTKRLHLKNSVEPWGLFQLLDSSKNSIICFASGTTQSIFYNQSNSQHEFEPFDSFGRVYWCEAFRFNTSEPVRSEEVLVRDDSISEFVAILEIEIPQPVAHNYSLGDYITSPPDFDKTISKILSINETVVTVNVHYAKFKLNDSDLVQDFQELNSFINNDNSLKLLELLNCDVCFFNSRDSWHVSSVNETEFCFVGGDLNSKILCERTDFTDGAKWNTTLECDILPKSTVTQKILNIFSEIDNDNISYAILSEWVEQFQSLDVFFVTAIYSKLNEKGRFNVTLFSLVMDKILNMNQEELIEAQKVARTTNRFLNLLETLTEDTTQSNFAFKSTHTGQICGIAFQKSGMSFINSSWTLDAILEQPDLEFAVFNDDSAKHLKREKLKLMLFLKNGLFAGNEPEVGTVSGTSCAIETFPSPLIIVQTRNKNETASCGSWSYKNEWKITGQYENTPQFHICKYWHPGYYAFLLNSKDVSNVTEDLEQLLEAEYDNDEKLQRLLDISQKFDEFKAIDVSLLGKVLETTYGNVNFTTLTGIVDNVHRIEKPILVSSQRMNKSTDGILSSVDALATITVDSRPETLIRSENFVLYVSNIQQSNFKSLIVYKPDDSIQVEIVRSNATTPIDTYKNIISYIDLSLDLKDQLQDARIVITIYFTDLLFNEDDPVNKSVSTIFGVILPEIGAYSGPISIFYNDSSESSQRECAHWHLYNRSFWNFDSTGSRSSGFLKCDFWHTTHFALLILDKNYRREDVILDWITAINSILSLLGLTGIFLTATLFKRWRHKTGNQILLNFSLAITLQIVTLYLSGVIRRKSEKSVECVAIGLLLHYSVISQFCWMFVIAVLQFKRFVEVFATAQKCLLLKVMVVGWIPPLVPVTAAVFLSKGYSTSFGLCYPDGLGLYVTVWLPILLIELVNFVIFIFITYNVLNKKSEHVIRDTSERKYQWGLFVLLFFMLGLTWISAFLAEFSVLFVYLFDTTATLQGFVLFLYFIVLNSETRYLYRHSLKKLCYGTESINFHNYHVFFING